jgi:hypothetical protein
VACVAGLASPMPEGAGAGLQQRPIAARESASERSRRQAEQAEVRCQSLDDCPEGVGLWAATTGRSVFQCTAFLIDSIHAVTDRHCIPQDIQREGATCEDRAWLHLPSHSGARGETIGCRSVAILSHTDSRVGDPDYAVVRLQRPATRAALRVERGPLSDLEAVEIVRVRPMDVEAALREVPVGKVSLQTCVVSRRTRSFADRDRKVDVLDPLSRRVPLVDCPAEGGNSGSPVLVRKNDGSRVVRALLDRSVDMRPVEAWARSNRIRLLDGTLTPIAWAGSFACLPLPGDSASWSPPLSCRVDSSLEALAGETTRWKAEVDGALDERAGTWGKGRGMRFSGGVFRPAEWPDLSKAIGGYEEIPDAFVLPVPRCLEAGTVLTSGVDAGTVPVWDVVFGFDRRLRWDFRVRDRLAELPVKLSVVPDPKGARMAMELTREKGLPVVLWKDLVPRCARTP